MSQDIIGSRFKNFTDPDDTFTTVSVPRSAPKSYGQNGDQTPSSLAPSQVRKISRYTETLAKPVDTSAMADNFQTRTVSAAPLKPAHSMRSRSHEGGTIPPNSRPVVQRPLNSTFRRVN